MKLKKLISLSLAGVMVFSLTACGGNSAAEEKSAAGGDMAASEDGAAGEDIAAEEGQVLKVAAVETAYGAKMWQDVCAAFGQANPGVAVELTIDKKLEDVITPDMKAGNYPDVILRAVGSASGLTETFIKDNNLVDLTDVLDMTVPGEEVTVGDKILPGFIGNSVTDPYGDGRTYLMPMFYGPCGLFYDAGLFKAKGWELPTTWDEMWELGDKAKAEGIALFTYPTPGYMETFFYSLIYQNMGNDMFQKALRYEEGIWDTQEAKKSFEIMGRLLSYTEPTTPANANDNDFLKNQQLILDDKALFMPNGNWVIGEMSEAPRAEGFEWGFMALPAVTEGGERASSAFFEQAWMPKGAVSQELGKRFMAYLYSDEAADIFAEEGGAVQPIEGMSERLDGDAKLYYSIYDTGAIPVIDVFATTEPVEGITIRTSFFDPLNAVATGDKTLDEWINQLKKDSDILRGALKE